MLACYLYGAEPHVFFLLQPLLPAIKGSRAYPFGCTILFYTQPAAFMP